MAAASSSSRTMNMRRRQLWWPGSFSAFASSSFEGFRAEAARWRSLQAQRPSSDSGSNWSACRRPFCDTPFQPGPGVDCPLPPTCHTTCGQDFFCFPGMVDNLCDLLLEHHSATFPLLFQIKLKERRSDTAKASPPYLKEVLLSKRQPSPNWAVSPPEFTETVC